MLTQEENELLTRSGRARRWGTLMRRYWIPALLAEELPEPDGDPQRVRLLGEDLVAFRDTTGQVGLLAEHCPHRGASLSYGAQRGVRACAASTTAGSSTWTAAAGDAPRAARQHLQGSPKHVAYPTHEVRRPDLGLHGAAGAHSRPSRAGTGRRRRPRAAW